MASTVPLARGQPCGPQPTSFKRGVVVSQSITLQRAGESREKGKEIESQTEPRRRMTDYYCAFNGVGHIANS